MNEAKKTYKRKCKSRSVDFYLHEEDLFNFSKQINFNKFVKDMLQITMEFGINNMPMVMKKWGKDQRKNG